ncbi:g8778 [Coccomyxa viridis]|uniref:G8778 protein n=1 Tax=Coccomyxa viridis TaxID=1274662 RepID=A0ABP1G185_9CHLO
MFRSMEDLQDGKASMDVPMTERHVMLRHVANRDIARRMGDGQKEDMNRLYKKADILETENVLLRQELLNAQAVELQLKGQLAQLQEDTAAMAHNHAGMRTTVACLRQPGAPLQPPESSTNSASWLAAGDPFPRDGEWLGCWDTLIEDLSLESVLAASEKGHLLP